MTTTSSVVQDQQDTVPGQQGTVLVGSKVTSSYQWKFCCVVSCVQFVGLLILVGIVQGFQNSNASELQRVFGNYSVFFSNDKVYTCNFKHVSRLSHLKNSITNSIFFLSGGQVLHLFVKIINLLLGYYQLANTGWDQGFSSGKFSSLGNKKKRGCNVFWK